MDNNSLSHSSDPSMVTRDGHVYVNIPIAGIRERRLDPEKYKSYKTLNNFCLFRILYQSGLAKSNSKHVSKSASKLWESVPKKFKDDLQKYCDDIKSKRTVFHFKKLYNQKECNKSRICKKRSSNETHVILSESIEKRWIQQEEFMNQYFQEEINELNIVETEPCNFNSSQYFNIINDSRKAEYCVKPSYKFVEYIRKN
ncbi:hypothetical protein RclHR1_18580001 [Rhizophagus clarus]|uniref:Uncharacterized protein n=1 Tax=Rhizophagus clarus TaxID=94130 RepID=A0A2Z6R008_9GLOM|nr:hypothetical protein RclHR1_18580001 [Rhizophagus clarus]GET04533.1 hypothetical protein GLOIN_2v1549304 [Rhizophagus clarus]